MAADIDEQPAGYERLLSAEHAAAIAEVAAVVAHGAPGTWCSPPGAPPTTPRSTRPT